MADLQRLKRENSLAVDIAESITDRIIQQDLITILNCNLERLKDIAPAVDIVSGEARIQLTRSDRRLRIFLPWDQIHHQTELEQRFFDQLNIMERHLQDPKAGLISMIPL